MTHYAIEDLPDGWSLRVEVQPAETNLSEAEQQLCEEIWEVELHKRKIYNGSIYCIKGFEGTELPIWPMEYKTVMAIERDRAFRERLQLYPLGVTGVSEVDGAILLGRRSKHVAIHREYWEPAPAGSLDRPDPESQLLQELYEETGLKEDLVVDLKAICLLHDVQIGIKDICYHIQLKPEARDAVRSNGEYSQLKWVERADLPKFIGIHPMTPAAQALLQRFLS